MQEKISHIFLRSLIGIIKLAQIIPLQFLYFMSDISGTILCKIASNYTKRMKSNLLKVFPDLSNKDVVALSRKVYANLYDFTYEIVKCSSFSEKEFISRCRIVNKDEITEVLRTNKRIICYSGHFVNYEWLVSFPLHMPNILMGNLYYSANSNPLIEWLISTRNRFGAITIPHNQPIKPILSMFEAIKQGKYDGVIIGTLADVPPYRRKDRSIHKSPFLKQFLSVYSGSERIGRKYNMTFMYAHIRRAERGYYSIEFKRLTPDDVDTNPYAYTDDFVSHLEQNIKEQPDLWMLWSNKRLKITN